MSSMSTPPSSVASTATSFSLPSSSTLPTTTTTTNTTSSTPTPTPTPTTTSEPFSLRSIFKRTESVSGPAAAAVAANSSVSAPLSSRDLQKLDELTEKVGEISETLKQLMKDSARRDEQQQSSRPQTNIVRLNVGGKIFATSQTTLTKTQHECMLTSMFSSRFGDPQRDEQGAVFIDRDPTHFGLILNFLRDNEVTLPTDELLLTEILREVEYYQIKDLTNRVRHLLKHVQRDNQRRTTKEKEYKILSNIQWEEIDKEVMRMTRDGFDFESWLPSNTDNQRFHVLFSKRLNQGEVAMLDRITNNVF